MEYQELDDLKKIKKEYGEKMAHLCREFFPSVLEKPGLLYHILSSHFAKSKELYYDIVSEHKEFLFKEYIYHFCDSQIQRNEEATKSVRELLSDAGYELYECKTNEDIQRFRRYYRSDEELCTFKDSHRLDGHYIFFIVKKNVDDIKRDDFLEPKREDEYGVSVLDLQFDKGSRQRVSIKSRYNHSVGNPDATYSNNLDAIIPGLSAAFERDYDFNIGNQYELGFELNHYVEARDGKFYKFNYEICNVHYCPNNIIIDNGDVVETYRDKSRYTFMDYYILDEKEKKLIVYDDKIIDSFPDGIKDIKGIEIENKEDYKEVRIVSGGKEDVIVKLDSNSRMVGYTNNNLEKCGDGFMQYNTTLRELSLSNLKECGNNFLYFNNKMEELSLPSLEKCGDSFAYVNTGIKTVNLPNLKECGNDYMYNNESITEIYLPNIIRCGDDFMFGNDAIKRISMPNLNECGKSFMYSSRKSKRIDLPNLVNAGTDFMKLNDYISHKTINNFFGATHIKINPECLLILKEQAKLSKEDIRENVSERTR